MQHKVANYNIETGEIFYKEPLDIIVRDLYDFEYMVKYESDRASLFITDTHRMIAIDSK